MIYYVIEGILVAVVMFIVGSLFGYQRRKATAEREIGSAEEEATRIVNDAYKSAESKKREALVEAKEEILKARNEYEQEEKERRADLQKQERRLQQKEENLDRKTENMEKKEEHLANRLAKLEATQAEAERIKQEQVDTLERISGFTAEEAKTYLLDQLEADVTHESAMKIKEIEARFKDEADTKAREIISLAIQRCAADHVAEATVSVVPLPNDEMKGRIIGREGRNIRTLETLTGVDLIIDDTPEAITVSCFDPVRREIARLALEKLILDGRIHPARIEEMVEKAKREVDATIKAEGERAIFETNVHGLHPELVKLLGRMRYRTSYGQNVLNHSIEVSHIAGLLAAEIGANVAEAKRAGLLHDLGKSIDHEVEGSHVSIGVELARKYRESEQRHSRHPRPPQRRGAPDRGGLPGPGGRRHLRRPPRCPARESGELYQASGDAGGDHLFLPPAWRSPSPSRPAARSASWSSPTRSARTRWCCWPGTSPRRSRTSWSIPARSRSTCCVRPRQLNTQSKCSLFHYKKETASAVSFFRGQQSGKHFVEKVAPKTGLDSLWKSRPVLGDKYHFRGTRPRK